VMPAGAEEQLELLLSFDGICYESEYFRKCVTGKLRSKIREAAAKRNPALVLVIAGWPSIDGYYDYVRYLREDTYAAAASRIIFLQNCTDGQLLYLYRRAAVFFSPAATRAAAARSWTRWFLICR
jgi:hypothetical protein